MTSISIEAMSQSNVANGILTNSKHGGRDSLDDLDIELYNDISEDGIFAVSRSEGSGLTAANYVGPAFDYLKRRIIVSSLKKAGMHDYHKLCRLNNIYVYEFDQGVHVTGIPDDRIASVVMYVNCGAPEERVPLAFTVRLK